MQIQSWAGGGVFGSHLIILTYVTIRNEKKITYADFWESWLETPPNKLYFKQPSVVR